MHGVAESDTTERLSMPCMMIAQLCEYAEKTLNCTLDDESYPSTAVYKKKCKKEQVMQPSS